MIPSNIPDCFTCSHKALFGRKCQAYGEQLVPSEIWAGQVKHRQLRGDEVVRLVYQPRQATPKDRR